MHMAFAVCGLQYKSYIIWCVTCRCYLILGLLNERVIMDNKLTKIVGLKKSEFDAFVESGIFL